MGRNVGRFFFSTSLWKTLWGMWKRSGMSFASKNPQNHGIPEKIVECGKRFQLAFKELKKAKKKPKKKKRAGMGWWKTPDFSTKTGQGAKKRWFVRFYFSTTTLFAQRSRMFLMISSTVALMRGSFFIFLSTCWVAYTIVEWSRPPNSLPMAASGSCVISRTT